MAAQLSSTRSAAPITLALYPPLDIPALDDDAPALVTMTTTEVFRHHSRVWAELASNAAVRVLYGSRPPRIRAWFTRECPPGATPVRVSVGMLTSQLTTCLDAAARGEVFEVAFGRFTRTGYGEPGQVCGYLHSQPPEAYKDVPLGPVWEPGAPEPWELVRDAYRDLNPEQRRRFREWFEVRTSNRKVRRAVLS